MKVSLPKVRQLISGKQGFTSLSALLQDTVLFTCEHRVEVNAFTVAGLSCLTSVGNSLCATFKINCLVICGQADCMLYSGVTKWGRDFLTSGNMESLVGGIYMGNDIS